MSEQWTEEREARLRDIATKGGVLAGLPGQLVSDIRALLAELTRLREENERLKYAVGATAALEVIGDLRRELAIAGVAGSPPTGRQGTIPELRAELAAARAAKDDAERSRDDAVGRCVEAQAELAAAREEAAHNCDGWQAAEKVVKRIDEQVRLETEAKMRAREELANALFKLEKREDWNGPLVRHLSEQVRVLREALEGIFQERGFDTLKLPDSRLIFVKEIARRALFALRSSEEPKPVLPLGHEYKDSHDPVNCPHPADFCHEADNAWCGQPESAHKPAAEEPKR